MNLKYPVKLFFVFCMVSSTPSFSQQPVQIHLKINGLSLFDPLYPTLQPGLEVKKQNWSLSYSYGFFEPWIFLRHVPEQNIFIQKNKMEARYFFVDEKDKKKDLRTLLFAGVEVFTMHYNALSISGTYNTGTPIRRYISYDSASNTRNLWGLAAEYGAQFRFANSPFGIELASGVGIRVIDNRYTDVKNPKPGILTGLYSTNYYRQGVRTTPHIFFSVSFVFNLSPVK